MLAVAPPEDTTGRWRCRLVGHRSSPLAPVPSSSWALHLPLSLAILQQEGLVHLRNSAKPIQWLGAGPPGKWESHHRAHQPKTDGAPRHDAAGGRMNQGTPTNPRRWSYPAWSGPSGGSGSSKESLGPCVAPHSLAETRHCLLQSTNG